jgi:hypothetical protein
MTPDQCRGKTSQNSLSGDVCLLTTGDLIRVRQDGTQHVPAVPAPDSCPRSLSHWHGYLRGSKARHNILDHRRFWWPGEVPGGDGDRGDDVAEIIVHIRGADPRISYGTVRDPGARSAAASCLVWGAAPDVACGLGATAP